MSSVYHELVNKLSYLKLEHTKLHLDDVIDYIISNNLSFVEGLNKLLTHEIDYKEMNMIKSMVRVGAFPHYREIKDFDFEFQPTICEQQINDFLTLRFIDNNENIVFLGNSGVGKTHLAVGIGIAAAKQRKMTYFIKCHDLIQNLKKAQLENRLADRLKHYTKYKLLIIDEIGYLPIEPGDSKLFFQLIDMRYEKRSTILTTNISFNNWDEVFHDAVIANAILDRILHHAKVVTITGKSYRIRNHINQTDDD